MSTVWAAIDAAYTAESTSSASPSTTTTAGEVGGASLWNSGKIGALKPEQPASARTAPTPAAYIARTDEPVALDDNCAAESAIY